jgi:hypothetical protein
MRRRIGEGVMAAPITLAARTALVLLVLGGCSSSTVETPANLAPAIPPGKAQLTINRVSVVTSVFTKASVDVNGQRLGDYAREERYTTFVTPGRTTVGVSAVSPPGRYTIGFNTRAGMIYRMQITVRPEGYAPETMSGPFAYELLENDGAFKIEPVE